MHQHATILTAIRSLGDDVATAITEVTHTLLWDDSKLPSLTRAQRELAFALVSKENDCGFCHYAHAAIAACHLKAEFPAVMEGLSDPDNSVFDEKTKKVLAFIDQMKTTGDQKMAMKAGAKDLAVDSLLHLRHIIRWADYENALVEDYQETPPLTDPQFYMGFGRKIVSVGGYKPMMDLVLKTNSGANL